MKKLPINISIILIAAFAMSCSEKECCPNQEEGNANTISGEWLLYERGYSPGAGYITEPVSSNPAQRIEFKDNGELSCTVEGLADYKFYSVKGDVVGLFKTNPGPAPDSLAFTNSYNFRFENGNLKLHFRYCFEGCHMAFKKIE
jgi:hypothetical protein